MSDELIELAQGFPDVSRQEWTDAVEQLLRGKPLSSLTHTLPEGIAVAPLHRAEDLVEVPAQPVGPIGDWGIRVRTAHPDPTSANAALVDELEQGATQVTLRLDEAHRSGTGEGIGVDGLAVAGVADLAAVLDGVLLDLAPVALEAGASVGRAGAALLDLLADVEGAAPASLGADPIGTLAATGSLPQGIDEALTEMVGLAARAVAEAPEGTTAVTADASAFHAAGATADLDLAVSLSMAVAYLRAMVDGGLAVDDAAGQIEWRLPIGVDQFLGIATVRAARRLWANVCEAAGVESSSLRLHVELVQSDLTARDPWVNLLRGTVAGFAAGVGGADSVTVPSFDLRTADVPGQLGRRIARNTQHLLQRESGLGHVADPAAGSWYVESLTSDLADAAWSAFQDLESRGGVLAALLDGSLRAQLAELRTTRDRAVATRRRPVTGVSEFPDVHAQPVESAPVDVAEAADAAAERSAGASMLPTADAVTSIKPLPVAPIAALFEALRDAADAHAARGQRARILLANLGPVARHTARATFAKNAFEAGGLEAIGTDGADEPAQVVTSLHDAGASLAVLCGDDEQYADIGAAIVKALKQAGATVWVAGRPDDALSAAGADGFVHVGVDLVDVLGQAHAAAGITASTEGA